VLCMGAGNRYDDMATEILVRILRDLHVDARHVSMKDVEEYEAEHHPEATPHAVSMIHIVNASGIEDKGVIDTMAKEMRQRARFAHAVIVAVLLPNLLEVQEDTGVSEYVDRTATSLEQAAQFTIEKVAT
jgi:hypothetical protein